MKMSIPREGREFSKLLQLRAFIVPIAFCAALATATIAFGWPGQAQNTTPPTAQGQGTAPGYGGAARGGASRGMQPDPEHPVLPIGSPFPDFSLPGVDGKTHTLSEYSGAKIIAVVFEFQSAVSVSIVQHEPELNRFTRTTRTRVCEI